jgi:hypothetical protein
MIIERIDDPDLISRLGNSGTNRAPGLHLSAIYGDFMSQLQPKRFDRSKPFNQTTLEMGLVFENMLERGLAEKFATVRPGELVSPEGVWMSPDGINPTYDAGEEYKFTRMSSRIYKGNTSPYTDEYGMPTDKFLHWFLQMKGYAKWLDTRKFLMRVLHVNGEWDRKKPGGMEPMFLSHLVTFTQAEIDENWTMLMQHARNRGML